MLVYGKWDMVFGYTFLGGAKMDATTHVGLLASRLFVIDVHLTGDEQPPIKVNSIKVGEYGSSSDFITICTKTRKCTIRGEYMGTDDVNIYLSVEQAIDLRNALNGAIDSFA